MSLTLFDLCGRNPDVRFSPPCWTVKFALLHKGLAFRTVPLGFAEKANYPDPDYGLLPMLDDGGLLVKDSMEIVAHLDRTRPEAPLLKTDAERAALLFYRAFLGAQVFPVLAPTMFIRVHDAVSADDQPFFRAKRERSLGMTLEAAAEVDRRAEIENALKTLAAPLANFRYFGGGAPNLIDYQVASVFMWVRVIADAELFEAPAPLAAWFERILDLFDGYARAAPRAHDPAAAGAH